MGDLLSAAIDATGFAVVAGAIGLALAIGDRNGATVASVVAHRLPIWLAGWACIVIVSLLLQLLPGDSRVPIIVVLIVVSYVATWLWTSRSSRS